MSFRDQLKHLFNWNRHYYFLSFALTLLAWASQFLNLYGQGLIEFGLLTVSFIACFLGFSKDHESWKYIQSLPLTRKELYRFKISDSVISLIPLTFWVVVHRSYVWELLTNDKVVSFEGFLKLMTIWTIGIGMVAVWSFYRIFEANRSPYVKNDLRSYNFQLLRNVIYGITAGIYALAVVGVIFMLLRDYQPKLFGYFLAAVEPFMNLWGVAFAMFLYLCYEYRRVFRRWMEEERSYIRLNWKPLRDLPGMAFALAMLILPPKYLINSSGTNYGDLPLIKAVQSGNSTQVKRLIDAGENLNRVSKHGFSPLMVAAHLGNSEIYNLLRTAGAKKEGVVWKGSEFAEKDIFELALLGRNPHIISDLLTKGNVNQPHRGFTPLHRASSQCSTEVIDLLLENGADPNALVKSGKLRGSTPLHLAARSRCVNGVISLIEKGADPLRKDLNGRLALNVLPGYEKDLKYYLIKKSRAPAAQDNK